MILTDRSLLHDSALTPLSSAVQPRIHSAPLSCEPGRAVAVGRVLVMT
jgi:hypothetical protein